MSFMPRAEGLIELERFSGTTVNRFDILEKRLDDLLNHHVKYVQSVERKERYKQLASFGIFTDQEIHSIIERKL